ncbi:MAG: hypothetical protein GXP14_10565 [Gammaproteobacteria bacterium]|nr:hypothetical protein [Gammaproteobacteria bacterium]
MLVSLKKHCSNLFSVLGETEYVTDWMSVAEWLQLAASVKSVDIDIIQHDPGFGMCSAADEYSMSSETLLNEFASGIVKFNFVWGALESSLNIIKPPNHPDQTKRGKIRNACYFLEKYFHSKLMLPFLVEETAKFRSTAQMCFGYQRVEERFKKAGQVGLPGVGLFGVYELRNSFAHGSMEFPEPDEENQPVSEHANMLEHATRIVLISIQMLLLAHFKDSTNSIMFAWNSDDSFDEYPLSEVLRGCHVVVCGEQNQLHLSL